MDDWYRSDRPRVPLRGIVRSIHKATPGHAYKLAGFEAITVLEVVIARLSGQAVPIATVLVLYGGKLPDLREGSTITIYGVAVGWHSPAADRETATAQLVYHAHFLEFWS